MAAYKKILLVDDDIDDRLIFEQILHKTDPSIVLDFAENGSEMISLLDQLPDEDLPELIILDQNMPIMSGKESLVFLKQSPRYNNTPVILYSTYQIRDFFLECRDMGALDVVPKPDTFQSYQEMIEQFLTLH